MPKLLEGIRVIEWAVAIAGAAAGYQLADLGAEVIRIEDPVKPEMGRTPRPGQRFMGIPSSLPTGTTPLWELTHRGKKSITINLRHPKGVELVHRLVAKADVFFNNFRPSVRKKNRLDYETLSQINPKLIYATTSMFGERGPWVEQRGNDTIGQASSGFMWNVGEPDMPPQQVTFGVVDITTATMLAHGIIMGLLARERYGIGQELYVSLFGTMIHCQGSPQEFANLMGQNLPRPMPQATAFNPLVNYHPTGKNGWLLISEGRPQERWHEFCEILGIKELENDPRFATTKARGENVKELNQIIADRLSTKSSREWAEIFWARDFQCSPVFTNLEVANDEQAKANEYIIEMDHPALGRTKHVGYPITLTKTPAQATTSVPEMGAHTEEVLLEIAGCSWDEIAELRELGVISPQATGESHVQP